MENSFTKDKGLLSEKKRETHYVSRRRFVAGGSVGLAGLAAGGISMLANTATAAAAVPSAHRQFDGKVVVITGATSGIGEATARAFAEEGASVFFCGRRSDLGEQVAASIRENGGEATYMQADVREELQVEAFIEGAVATYGRIDIAFNNAGIEGAGSTPGLDGSNTIPHIPVEGWAPPANGIEPRRLSYDDVMSTNLNGVFYAMRYELPVMQEQGSGVIINTASVQGSKGSADTPAYSASKHGVIGLTQSAALANAEYGIRVLSISPGPVDTALLRRIYRNDLENLRKENPLGVAEPSEIAAMVVRLASPAASFMTGADVKIDGGSTA